MPATPAKRHGLSASRVAAWPSEGMGETRPPALVRMRGRRCRFPEEARRSERGSARRSAQELSNGTGTGASWPKARAR